MDDKLRKIQLCQLDILNEIVRICDAHNIDYWLAYGTMLGAVRHEGFIPWDDDLDIYMTLDGAKQFEKYCKQELHHDYFLQNSNSERCSAWLFWKMRKNGTFMLEPGLDKKQFDSIHKGIWVDIFPLILAGDNGNKFEKQIDILKKLQLFRFYHIDLVKGTPLKARLREYALTLHEKLLWRRVVALGKNGARFLVIGNSFYDKTLKNIPKETFPIELFSQKNVYAFEGTQFAGVANYNSYLTHVYGENYMTPIKYEEHVPDRSGVIV